MERIQLPDVVGLNEPVMYTQEEVKLMRELMLHPGWSVYEKAAGHFLTYVQKNVLFSQDIGTVHFNRGKYFGFWDLLDRCRKIAKGKVPISNPIMEKFDIDQEWSGYQ